MTAEPVPARSDVSRRHVSVHHVARQRRSQMTRSSGFSSGAEITAKPRRLSVSFRTPLTPSGTSSLLDRLGVDPQNLPLLRERERGARGLARNGEIPAIAGTPNQRARRSRARSVAKTKPGEEEESGLCSAHPDPDDTARRKFAARRARATGLEPATSGVTGRSDRRDARRRTTTQHAQSHTPCARAAPSRTAGRHLPARRRGPEIPESSPAG